MNNCYLCAKFNEILGFSWDDYKENHICNYSNAIFCRQDSIKLELEQ